VDPGSMDCESSRNDLESQAVMPGLDPASIREDMDCGSSPQ
jgi:hypothetical protein